MDDAYMYILKGGEAAVVDVFVVKKTKSPCAVMV